MSYLCFFFSFQVFLQYPIYLWTHRSVPLIEKGKVQLQERINTVFLFFGLVSCQFTSLIDVRDPRRATSFCGLWHLRWKLVVLIFLLRTDELKLPAGDNPKMLCLELRSGDIYSSLVWDLVLSSSALSGFWVAIVLSGMNGVFLPFSGRPFFALSDRGLRMISGQTIEWRLKFDFAE